jgi:hypothetical protein
MGGTAAVAGAEGAAVAQLNGGTAQPTGAAAEPFYSTFADADLKGYAENKRWANPEEAVKSYREYEKSRGIPQERLLALPDPALAKPEDWNAVYDRLGRPATPAEYKIPAIEGDEKSAKFTDAMKPILHGIGLTQDQAVKLKTAWDGYITNEAKARDAEQAQREQVDMQELHRVWPGEVFAQREEMARKFGDQIFIPATGGDRAKAIELAGKIEDAIGTSAFLKIFAHGGEKLGEAKFASGNGAPSSFGMTPAGAKARKAELMADKEWGAKALVKGTAQAQELDRLQRIEDSAG